MVGNSFSPDEEKHFCCYCGRWLVGSLLYNKEHLVPKSKGGNDTTYNKKLCCVLCNKWRADKSLSYWKSEIQECINNKRSRFNKNIQDMETMIENIDYWMHYVETAGQKLYRSNYIIKL